MDRDPFLYFRKAWELNHLFADRLAAFPARFRGNRESISLVSLSADQPQLGVPLEGVGSYDVFDLDYYLELVSRKGKPNRDTPEKRAQSALTSTALPYLELDFGMPVTFVTDELALYRNSVDKTGKIVFDIIGFNNDSGSLVLIELKSSRSLKELSDQLFESARVAEEQQLFFQRLLAIHGHTWRTPYSIEKIAVWPLDPSPRARHFQPDIIEVVYTEEDGQFQFQLINDRKKDLAIEF